MIVICLEGCHGCGKTYLCDQFSKAGFEVLDEAFIDMPSYALHPQSLTMETLWVANWFQRLLKKNHECGGNGVYIVDRSPHSAELYSKSGGLLAPMIKEQIKELADHADIEIYTVYIEVEDNLLWSRISERLKRNPDRKLYNEDKRAWMDEVLEFYRNHSWDFTIDNGNVNIQQVMAQLLFQLTSRVETFEHQSPVKSPVPFDQEDAKSRRAILQES